MIRRAILTGALALLTGALSLQYRASAPGALPSDFTQAWAGAGAWRHGTDPYTVVGPGRSVPLQFPLAYPLTAVIVALPFSFLPLRWADAAFAACGIAALVWALTRKRLANPSLLVFASIAFVYVIQTTQWSPLVTAAALLPPIGWLWVCKPTIGAALLLAYPNWRSAAAGVLFVAVSFALHPGWPREWIATLSTTPHVIPLIRQTMAGPLVLLALVRWRHADARLLVALACVPQTPLLYEAIPLFLIVQTWLEGAILVVLTYVAWIWWVWAGPYASYGEAMAGSGRAIVWFLYLPLTALVLWRAYRDRRRA